MFIRWLLDTGQSDEALDMLHNMAQKHSRAPNTVSYSMSMEVFIDFLFLCIITYF
jgi:pentatricopeptide repeat protein